MAESGENSPPLFIPESWPAMFDQVFSFSLSQLKPCLVRYFFSFHFHFHNKNHPQTSAEDFGIGSTPTTELPTLPLELQAFKDNAKVQKDSKQNYLMQQITGANYKNQ